MSEDPKRESGKQDGAETIYGDSPGSERSGPSGISGKEQPPEGGESTIYSPHDEDDSADS